MNKLMNLAILFSLLFLSMNSVAEQLLIQFKEHMTPKNPEKFLQEFESKNNLKVQLLEVKGNSYWVVDAKLGQREDLERVIKLLKAEEKILTADVDQPRKLMPEKANSI